MKGFIPISLDLEQHLLDFPPTKFGIKHFDKDHLIFLLSQIVLVPASNRKVLDNMENGYVPLSSKIMQSVVHEYAKYWKYLKCTGVIDIREKYFPKIFFNEGVCKGYRFSNKYLDDSFKVECYTDSFKNKLKRDNIRELRIEFLRLKEYSHLLKWLYPKCNLNISYEEAISFLKLEKRALIKSPELREKRNRGKDKIFKTGKTKNPYYQFDLAKINIDKIQNGELSFIIDENVQRLHTVLTNIKSVVRNYIKYDGKELVSIDLGNSQPYLSTKLLRKEFWAKPTKTNKITYKTISKTTKQANTPYMLEILEQLVDSKQIIDYETRVGYSQKNDGDLYSFMEEKYNERNIPHDGRTYIKSGMFEVFFSSNKYKSIPKEVFKDVFPLINKIFELIKDADKASLPILLQRLESHIFLKILTKKIATRFPKAPIFTIHDSIVTTAEYCDEFKLIMDSELTRLIGIPPILKVEKWNENDPKLIKKRELYLNVVNRNLEN